VRRSPRVLLAGMIPEGGQGEALDVARALRDAGWEVVHLGEVPAAAVVAAVARDEDADAVVVLPAPGDAPPGLVAGVDAELARLGRTGVRVVDAGVGATAVVAELTGARGDS